MPNDLQRIDPKTIGTELQKYKGQMEAALPRHMTADRMARIALTALRVNPKLLDCSRESFYGSLMAASQLGLEPGINGQCYLIPYGNTCTLVPGWRGYMDLLNRTERAAARTEAVYDGDEFDYEMGTDLKIHHKHGKWGGNPDAITHAYAVGKIKGMEDFPIIDVWDVDKIKWHRDKQNKVGNRHYSYAHFEMYARKLPLLQILKYLPSSIELANAAALDVTGTEGRQNLTIDMALKGELENGAAVDVPSADDPAHHEIDVLFDKLKTNPANQRMLRESYATRPKELVDYLKGKLVPVQVTTEAAPVARQDQPAADQDAPNGEVKRGRGRPRKEPVADQEAQPLMTPATTEEGQPVYFPPTDEEVQNGDLPAAVDPTEEAEQDDFEQEDGSGSAFELE